MGYCLWGCKELDTTDQPTTAAESYGESWFFVVSHFLEQRMVGGLFTVIDGAQGEVKFHFVTREQVGPGV